MQLSFWEKNTFFEGLDVVIVGSGIVGLNTALCLKQQQPALKVIVLERGFLPYGASTRNAGFACFGSVSELLDDLTKHTEDEVLSLVERRWKGLLRLRRNLGDENIVFENLGGYELFTVSDELLHEGCTAKIEDLNRSLAGIIGQKEVYKSADKKIPLFGFHQITHLIECATEGQIDTGKMMKSLLEKTQQVGVILLNGIGIEHFEDTGTSVEIHTNQGFSINTRRLLIATNGFAKELLPELAVKPARAQVLITKPIHGLKVRGTFHYDKGFYYFRNVGNRLLLGGGRNLDFETEATDEFGLTELVQNKLVALLQTIILPEINYEIEQRWSGIMGIGQQKNTIVKPLSENVFCAVRMGGMGIAIGTLIGEEAATMVLKSFGEMSGD